MGLLLPLWNLHVHTYVYHGLYYKSFFFNLFFLQSLTSFRASFIPVSSFILTAIFFESLPIQGVGATQSVSVEGMNELVSGCYPTDALLLADKL